MNEKKRKKVVTEGPKESFQADKAEGSLEHLTNQS